MPKGAQLIYLLLVLVLVLPALLYALRQKSALRNAVIWLALFTALVVGYNFFMQRQGPAPVSVSDQSKPSAPPAPAEEGPVREL